MLFAFMAGGATLTYLLLHLFRPRTPGPDGRNDEASSGRGGSGEGDASGPIVPSPLFVVTFLFAALLLVGAAGADDPASALGVVLLAISAFIVAPQLIATRLAADGERHIFEWFRRRTAGRSGRLERIVSSSFAALHALLLVALVVFGYLIIAGSFFCDFNSPTMLTVAYAMAPAIYAGFVILWLAHTTRAALSGAGGSAKLIGIDRVRVPLERSPVAGLVATVCFIGGTVLLYYAAWRS